MAKNRGGQEFKNIEKIFDQLSSSVAIALLKEDKLAYEFYGGRKAALAGNGKAAPAGNGKAALAGNGEADARQRGKADGKKVDGKSAADDKKAAGKTAADKSAADKHAETGISRITRFNIGSASAMFTGALAIKLMEFGEVRLSDAARRFIPEFPYDDVTVYHLMTHSSGLGSECIPLPENQAARKEFYRKLFSGLKPIGIPGQKSDYFQYDYAILAYIVEKISGQTLEELASVLLFMPLGMKNTTFNGAALRDNQYVIPWNHRENRFMTELHAKQPTGQGGAYTTALDLLRFGRVFLNRGEFEGKQVFLGSSVEFMLREISNGRLSRTPLFMIKRKADVFGCFSEKLSPESVALTGHTGAILFIDPVRRIVGTALANTTWVDAVSQNYGNIIDILMTI